MPKADINRAFQISSEKRKKAAGNATNILIGVSNPDQSYDLDLKNTHVPVQSVPLSKIKERDINEFSIVNNKMLEESIRKYGVIDPITLIKTKDSDLYTICSGHRRFIAVKSLHAQYPEDPRFSYIDACIYSVTDDPEEIQKGLPYISKETEDRMYREANMQSRQLSTKDVAKQIRKIYHNFEDPEYVTRISNFNTKENGDQTIIYKNIDRSRLAASILGSMNYSGFSAETIRKYGKIYDAKRDDLLDKIETGELKVDAAYKILNEETGKSRERKTNKLKGLEKSISDMVKESKNKHYSEKEIEKIKSAIETLQNIVSENER